LPSGGEEKRRKTSCTTDYLRFLQKPIPMDAGLSTPLLDWRSQCPYNQSTDYVFASAEKKGHQPLWPSSAMSKHIRPAATGWNPEARSLARIQTDTLSLPS
jgi:hypothetical protein